VAGAIADQLAVTLAYVAPEERAMAKARSDWPPLKSIGSTTAVTSGRVPDVVYVRVRWALASPADAVAAARHTIAAAAVR
jgi:hypothetical protein